MNNASKKEDFRKHTGRKIQPQLLSIKEKLWVRAMSRNQMIEEPPSTNMENTMQEPKKLLERQPKTIKTSLGSLG